MSYEGSRPLEPQDREGRGLVSGSLVLAVLAVIGIAAFIFQNTDKVHVDWLFFSGEWPLWLVVVLSIVLTLIAAPLIAYVVRRRRNKGNPGT